MVVSLTAAHVLAMLDASQPSPAVVEPTTYTDDASSAICCRPVADEQPVVASSAVDRQR